MFFCMYTTRNALGVQINISTKEDSGLRWIRTINAISACHGRCWHQPGPQLWCAYPHKTKYIIAQHERVHPPCPTDHFILNPQMMDIFKGHRFHFQLFIIQSTEPDCLMIQYNIWSHLFFYFYHSRWRAHRNSCNLCYHDKKGLGAFLLEINNSQDKATNSIEKMNMQ